MRENRVSYHGDPARLSAERGHPLILGHRGMPGAGVENRIEAFQAALDAGADGVEFDVQLSSDGVPMIIHDSRLDRTTEQEGKVSDFPAEELDRLGLPRLAAALEQLRYPAGGTATGPVLNIELKDFSLGDRGLESRVIDRVRAAGAEDRVLFSSFNPLSLARVRRIDRRFYAAQLTSPGGPGAVMRAGYLWNPGAVHPHFLEVTPAKLAAWRRRGRRVMVYAADTAEDIKTALGWGLDGIITDRPAEGAKLATVIAPGAETPDRGPRRRSATSPASRPL